jgi:predicted RNase H-like nuclease
MRWLQLFMPFNGAREVQVWVCNDDQSDDGIVNALHESTEMDQEVFPALCILRLRGFGTKTPQGIKSFVNERRRTRETVTVFRSRRYGSESDVESVF